MSGCLNEATLIGNLVRDPEVRTLQAGGKVVNLRIATSERWKDHATGDRKERTEFHSIVIFNEALGRVAEGYTKKGTKLFVRGQLQTRKWSDKDGIERHTTEIVLQRFRGELTILDAPRSSGSDEPRERVTERSAPARSMAEDLSDDIPFSPEWR
ncbi:MAG: single-stranded DNA-binding protein [Chelatococcus sp.]|uniref:single-stranded DNA-binding protein n=1 Tax=Chelatococcus sp. TaxID=1953771 RepID=UPI0026208804|nr:single-stranded DNA-binding protein [Chelatococcus sp.]MCO5079196.1 single-stranded DNA-binding protein [Chelatococcus sp.]